MGTSLKEKNLRAPFGSEFFPLRAVPSDVEKQYFYIIRLPLIVYTFIKHVLNCVMGVTPM